MSASEILVCNCGSSSVKIDLFDFSDGERYLASATAERLGTPEAGAEVEPAGGESASITGDFGDHTAALRSIAAYFESQGWFAAERRLAVGHRVVHGAHYVSAPVLLGDEQIEMIEKCVDFAPLHNPANRAGINACRELFPGLPQVGVFDTAFHARMPARAYTYAIPLEIAEKHNIRRYGFHGTSHEYVTRIAAEMLGKPYEQCKLISAHLGNGASVCAVDGGVSVDTSMGFTPLEGLVMGSRCGDMDPALFGVIAERESISVDDVDMLLNKKSGLAGVSGRGKDMRDILRGAAEGDERCVLARDLFSYRVRKYVGAYLAVLGGADAVIFTAGIGQNADEIRARSLEGLDALGIVLDPKKNDGMRERGDVAAADSPTRVLVIPTDEELMIARSAAELTASA